MSPQGLNLEWLLRDRSSSPHRCLDQTSVAELCNSVEANVKSDINFNFVRKKSNYPDEEQGQDSLLFSTGFPLKCGAKMSPLTVSNCPEKFPEQSIFSLLSPTDSNVVYNRQRRRRAKQVSYSATRNLPSFSQEKLDDNSGCERTCCVAESRTQVVINHRLYDGATNFDCLDTINVTTCSALIKTSLHITPSCSVRHCDSPTMVDNYSSLSNTARRTVIANKRRIDKLNLGQSQTKASIYGNNFVVFMLYLLNTFCSFIRILLDSFILIFSWNTEVPRSLRDSFWLWRNPAINSFHNKCLYRIFCLLLFIALVKTEEPACPISCTCSLVPSSSLASQKWASLMPTATPSLLKALMSPKSPYAGKLPFLLHPRIIHNLSKIFNKTLNNEKFEPEDRSLYFEDSSENIITEGVRRYKRDVRHSGHFSSRPRVQENDLEFTPSSSSSSEIVDREENSIDEYSNIDNDKNLLNPDEDILLNNFNLRYYLEYPYLSHLLIEKPGDNNSEGNPHPHYSSAGSGSANPTVPLVIEEQIPDLYSSRTTHKQGGRVEETELDASEESSAFQDGLNHPGDAASMKSYAVNDADQVAVVCDTKALSAVPGQREDGILVNFENIVSL